MKRDQEILEQVAWGYAPPTLRLYLWKPPAVSLGYFQREEDVVDQSVCRRRGIDVVRRPTGGRALLHYREVTYSLIVPESYSQIPPGIVEAYRFLSGGLVRALQKLRLHPQVAPESSASGQALPGSCFDTASAFELQMNGKKVVGSAQLRRRGVLLQHGSVLLELCPELNGEVFGVLKGSKDLSSVRKLQEGAAGLRDLGLNIKEMELMTALQEGFAEYLGVQFSSDASVNPGDLLQKI